MLIATLVKKLTRPSVASILKLARTALDNGVNRTKFYREARVKLYQDDNQYYADLEGAFCGATTNNYDTLKEVVEAAVRIADREEATITAWVRKF